MSKRPYGLTDEQMDYIRDTSLSDDDGNAREDVTMEEMVADHEKFVEAFGEDEC